MEKSLLSPPIAFIIVFISIGLFSAALSKLSFRPKKLPEGARKSYACGEDAPTNLIQPDYVQFFPFAFFFTILHVIALVVATVPIETFESFTIAVIYLAGAITGLFILFRR
ncbi:MAG: hypothetical protein KBB52_07550 [Candidatus Omnitrophica bacterium]|nr:hypothetical protein [Candidatus Omnitrophota bacterium]